MGAFGITPGAEQPTSQPAFRQPTRRTPNFSSQIRSAGSARPVMSTAQPTGKTATFSAYAPPLTPAKRAPAQAPMVPPAPIAAQEAQQLPAPPMRPVEATPRSYAEAMQFVHNQMYRSGDQLFSGPQTPKLAMRAQNQPADPAASIRELASPEQMRLDQEAAAKRQQEFEQQKARQKLIDEWNSEAKRALMSPDEYAAQRRRSREFDQSTRPQVTHRNRNTGEYDREMANKFYDNRQSQQDDRAAQEQFLKNYKQMSFDDWSAARKVMP